MLDKLSAILCRPGPLFHNLVSHSCFIPLVPINAAASLQEGKKSKAKGEGAEERAETCEKLEPHL